MSDAIDPGLWHRVRYTPLRDVVRGRMSGRLDVAARIGSTDLPESVKALIARVVKRTRLWSLEKVAVADELIAHFSDGLEAGREPDELIQAFGEPGTAARLIRRAMKRNRGLAWQIVNLLRWLGVALITFYIVCGIYFYTGRPTVAVDYTAILNQPAVSVPVDHRAWPIYRQAILALRDPNLEENRSAPYLFDARPDSPEWPRMLDWLKAHQRGIDLAVEASRRPVFGFILGPGGSAYDPEIFPDYAATSRASGSADKPLLSVALPYLNEIRRIANILSADARVARRQDPPRARRDIETLLRMSDQIRGHDFLLTDMVSLGIRAMAVNETIHLLHDNGGTIDPADLQRLAHELAEPDSADELISFRGERIMCRDMVQRMYTDDGHGDGRLTPEGLQFLGRIGQTGNVNLDTARVLTGPIAPALMASRKQLLEKNDAVMDAAEADLHRPIRQIDLRERDQRVISLKSSLSARLQYAPLAVLIPYFYGPQASAEQYLGQRDGALIAIALAFYRGEHGKYPAALDELSPSLLPELPVDRITGGALHYRIADGQPVVYSVGADEDDDGGRAPRTSAGELAPRSAAAWGATRPPDGDWVLYPPVDAE